MIIKKEISLKDFEAWSGAKYIMETLSNLAVETDRDIFEELENELEMAYFNEWDETELNDFLWFEDDAIAEMLGFDDWEQIERIVDGEDEEDEEEE